MYFISRARYSITLPVQISPCKSQLSSRSLSSVQVPFVELRSHLTLTFHLHHLPSTLSMAPGKAVNGMNVDSDSDHDFLDDDEIYGGRSKGKGKASAKGPKAKTKQKAAVMDAVSP